MMSTQLERIALKTKAIQSFVLPQIPKMPVWVVRKFELTEYEAQMELWRQNAQEGIRSALQAVQSQPE